MKRQWKLLLCLLLAALALCACSGGQTQDGPTAFVEVTQNLGPTELATATPEPTQSPDESLDGGSIFSSNPYDVASDYTANDPLNEEDVIDTGLTGDAAAGAYDSYASAEDTVYPYSGSTPIPLDPVDMPSPTPRPALAFTYVAYQPNSLGSNGVTFEAPAGWVPDESVNEVYTLSEPEDQIRDGQQCVITIAAVPVTSNYSESNLKTEVRQRLDTLSATNYTSWNPSLTATRHLLGSVGVYANYSGTLANGVKVGGRVHYACVDKVLYSIEIVYPLAYKDDYLNVFSQVRTTIKRAQ